MNSTINLKIQKRESINYGIDYRVSNYCSFLSSLCLHI